MPAKGREGGKRTRIQGAIQILPMGSGCGGGLVYFFDEVRTTTDSRIEKVGPYPLPPYGGSAESEILLASAEQIMAGAVAIRNLFEGRE